MTTKNNTPRQKKNHGKPLSNAGFSAEAFSTVDIDPYKTYQKPMNRVRSAAAVNNLKSSAEFYKNVNKYR